MTDSTDGSDGEIDRVHGPHRVPRIGCGRCGHKHHIDATTGEYQGRCAECYAFLRRPTEVEKRAFYRFMDWKARWTEHQRGGPNVA